MLNSFAKSTKSCSTAQLITTYIQNVLLLKIIVTYLCDCFPHGAKSHFNPILFFCLGTEVILGYRFFK